MKIRLKYKKISKGKESSPCWFCSTPTYHVLFGMNEDYFEVWCCQTCKKKHGIVRKHKKKEKPLKAISFQIINKENQELPFLKEGMELNSNNESYVRR